MKTEPPCLCARQDEKNRDRYVSFIGLDCSGQARRLIAMLSPYMEDPDKSNPFWQLFAQKLHPVSGPRHDELFLIHAHLNILRDQLEQQDDQAALELLEQIEHECC